MNVLPFSFSILLSLSCEQTSNQNDEMVSTPLAEHALVKSLSYTRHQETQISNHEANEIKIRIETNTETGNVRTYNYVYTNNLISHVEVMVFLPTTQSIEKRFCRSVDGNKQNRHGKIGFEFAIRSTASISNS